MRTIGKHSTHLLLTKPFEGGSFDFFGKWGNERSGKPSGIRCPLIICCPTQATICATFRFEPFGRCQLRHIPTNGSIPLEPQTAMVRGALCLLNSVMQISAHLSRTLDRTPETLDSSVPSRSKPAASSSLPSFACLISSSEALYPLLTTISFSAASRAPGVTSLIPIEKPRFAGQISSAACVYATRLNAYRAILRRLSLAFPCTWQLRRHRSPAE